MVIDYKAAAHFVHAAEDFEHEDSQPRTGNPALGIVGECARDLIAAARDVAQFFCDFGFSVADEIASVDVSEALALRAEAAGDEDLAEDYRDAGARMAVHVARRIVLACQPTRDLEWQLAASIERARTLSVVEGGKAVGA